MYPLGIACNLHPSLLATVLALRIVASRRPVAVQPAFESPNMYIQHNQYINQPTKQACTWLSLLCYLEWVVLTSVLGYSSAGTCTIQFLPLSLSTHQGEVANPTAIGLMGHPVYPQLCALLL